MILTTLLLFILFSFSLPRCFTQSYLFVGLSEQNAHTLHWQAVVAQRTGVTAEARGSVHTLHSGEAGVKLALRNKKEDMSSAEAAGMYVSLRAFPQKLLGLMTFLLM